jgi:hypothetical protein
LDLPRRLLVARRSYDRPYPKSRKQRVVRIPDELVPCLEHAIATFPGPWLFPDDPGGMRTVTWQPEDILRRALRRAGIVTGYTHVCRRRTCRYTEERPDAEIRPCPRCGFKLWPKGNVWKILRKNAARQEATPGALTADAYRRRFHLRQWAWQRLLRLGSVP